MSLNTLVDYISNSQITSELIKRISKNNELNIVGSSRYAKSIILDSIAKKEDKNINKFFSVSEIKPSFIKVRNVRIPRKTQVIDDKIIQLKFLIILNI